MRLACCGSAADFLADKWSANFPEATDEVFPREEDLGVVLSPDVLFLVEPTAGGDSEPVMVEVLLQFKVSLAGVDSSLVGDFFIGDSATPVRRTCEG